MLISQNFVFELYKLRLDAAPEVDVDERGASRPTYRDGYANGFQEALRAVIELFEEELD